MKRKLAFELLGSLVGYVAIILAITVLSVAVSSGAIPFGLGVEPRAGFEFAVFGTALVLVLLLFLSFTGYQDFISVLSRDVELRLRSYRNSSPLLVLLVRTAPYVFMYVGLGLAYIGIGYAIGSISSLFKNLLLQDNSADPRRAFIFSLVQESTWVVLAVLSVLHMLIATIKLHRYVRRSWDQLIKSSAYSENPDAESQEHS